MIEEGLFSLVTQAPPVAELIGKRFYPDVLPEPCIFPAVTYRDISLVDWRTFDGSGVAQVRLELEIWADSRAAGKAVAAALFQLLDDFSGRLPNGLAADITRDNQRSGFDKELRRYYVQTDWLLQVG